MKRLNFIYDYLRNRKQITKIDNAYSSWQNILYEVSQISILWRFLFNIDLCDLFLIMSHEDIANYADDNTLAIMQMTIRPTFFEKILTKWLDF